jgi:hypothetical protein
VKEKRGKQQKKECVDFSVSRDDFSVSRDDFSVSHCPCGAPKEVFASKKQYSLLFDLQTFATGTTSQNTRKIS